MLSPHPVTLHLLYTKLIVTVILVIKRSLYFSKGDISVSSCLQIERKRPMEPYQLLHYLLVLCLFPQTVLRLRNAVKMVQKRPFPAESLLPNASSVSLQSPTANRGRKKGTIRSTLRLSAHQIQTKHLKKILGSNSVIFALQFGDWETFYSVDTTVLIVIAFLM